MEISEESYLFWTTLESDMKTKLKDYIKNTLSFGGYGTALSFKDLDQTDIQSTENYVRNTLPIILDSALTEQKMEYTLNEKMWFFGPFATAPQHFTFPPGELKTLFALVRHVKQVVDQPNECVGLNHFANAALITGNRLSYEQNMVQSVLGLVFGCLREKKQIKLADSIVEKQKELFKKANTIFEQYEIKDSIMSTHRFTLESVNVNFEDQKWKGTVKCIFCNENDINGDVKIYFKPPSAWVLSNLIKHIKSNHIDPITKGNQTSKKECVHTVRLQIDPVLSMLVDDGKDDVTEEAANSIEGAAISIEEAKNSIEGDTLSNDLSTESIEDILYGQLSTQCIKMTNRRTGNAEKVHKKHFSMRSRGKRSVEYCRMAANGDCFFLSIAHQLSNVKVGSKEHQDRAFELRKSVVAYIAQDENFPNFLHNLKNRVQYDKNCDDDKIKDICFAFLTNRLSQAGTWGGMESIKAICEIENTNIIVINEDGSGYIPNHFNPQANQSLILLFSSQNGKSKTNAERSHYDSVVAIQKEKISEIIQQISAAENHHDEFIKEAADRSAIVIE